MLDYQELLDRIVSLENRVAFLERSTKNKSKNSKEKTPGAKVFDAYSKAIFDRYGTEPIRNAMVNRQCSELVKRVGEDSAIELVRFFVAQNEQYYVKKVHPISLCLKDCEGLTIALRTRMDINGQDARKIEKRSSSVSASRSYLSKKHGLNHG